MKCAICLAVKEGEPFDAVTIKAGTAVCQFHWHDVADPNVAKAYNKLVDVDGAITYQTDADFLGSYRD